MRVPATVVCSYHVNRVWIFIFHRFLYITTYIVDEKAATWLVRMPSRGVYVQVSIVSQAMTQLVTQQQQQIYFQ